MYFTWHGFYKSALNLKFVRSHVGKHASVCLSSQGGYSGAKIIEQKTDFH